MCVEESSYSLLLLLLLLAAAAAAFLPRLPLEAEVDSVAFCPHGVEVMIVSQHKVWLWNICGRTPVRCFPGMDVSMKNFTPDGKGVLTSGRRGTAVWSAACSRLCLGFRPSVQWTVAFSHGHHRPGRW